ncbi:CCR4-NOT transcription complex subunit 11 [Caenorhabditis elegans]|uniref:CCR4-NOT transcription complex subunit 11 n=2 Tax=Caenorhabditis elegans TaxID=6239 RepID=A0A078BTL9_CAEEL|nr:CCR4-NOT transcription complex subunit 11 [Caenorhabditis elegans]CDX47473.1 CCR4-NOT transcription complex subunit 11 [Caenorhabditis elegans]|eukprot:NP_001294106.1 NOT-Like (yeast CCR4/NOT complex component) [Caenorhabditis elegans]
MTKKKAKKNQKTGAAAAPPHESQKKEKENDFEMLEDIKRDEDLFFSETDISNISNFIRTTNKSFNSLGNTFVEQFTNRCSLAIFQALATCFEIHSEERDDVIRRLNIIYIVWRLPDLEPELRPKPPKNLSDVYSHPYATFLFAAEQIEHRIEAMLARIIVSNNINQVEKLTAPDFIQKAAAGGLTVVVEGIDRTGFVDWCEANTDHWPEVHDSVVPLPKAMRELGCERKDYESGMAEAFYPIMHNAPTQLPPRMEALEQEDPIIREWRLKVDPENTSATPVIYSMCSGDKMQEELMQAFDELEPTIAEYQSDLIAGMTAPELEELNKQIDCDDQMSQSSDSAPPSEVSSDLELDTALDIRDGMTMPLVDLKDEVIEGCVDRILDGTTLTTSKSDMMIQFVRTALITHPQYDRLLQASVLDENIISFIRTNVKFAGAFLVRNALSEQDTCLLFKRYMRLCEGVNSTVHSLETVLKLSKEFIEHDKLTQEHREVVLAFVRHTIRTCEGDRTVRLVAMLVKKLLRERVLNVEDIAADVKPFTLKYTDNRECTALYQSMINMQNGGGGGGQENMTTSTTTTTTTTKSSSPNSLSTTTTTTSHNPGASATTTTTTVSFALL